MDNNTVIALYLLRHSSKPTTLLILKNMTVNKTVTAWQCIGGV